MDSENIVSALDGRPDGGGSAFGASGNAPMAPAVCASRVLENTLFSTILELEWMRRHDVILRITRRFTGGI